MDAPTILGLQILHSNLQPACWIGLPVMQVSETQRGYSVSTDMQDVKKKQILPSPK